MSTHLQTEKFNSNNWKQTGLFSWCTTKKIIQCYRLGSHSGNNMSNLKRLAWDFCGNYDNLHGCEWRSWMRISNKMETKIKRWSIHWWSFSVIPVIFATVRTASLWSAACPEFVNAKTKNHFKTTLETTRLVNIS